jgi:hypothetical protein
MTITLYQMDEFGAWVQIAETTTDSNGYYSFGVCGGGSYKVVEETRDGWEATSETEFTFTAVSGESQTYDFFNYELGQICGTKWYDFDKDGVQDVDEDVIAGFKIELYKDGSLFATATTDSNGEYCFTDLGPGDYSVQELMPNNPGDYWIWAQTYPGEGWTFAPLISGTDADADFGNVVEFTGGLTWGYWKTHTGLDSPPKDAAYDLLGANPMEVDVEMPDGDYLVDNVYDAKYVFDGAGDYPASCSGDCRTLFRAQLLALHMNLLKFTDMGGAIYVYDGDPFNGQTVQDIYDAAIALLNDGLAHDFQPFQVTLDHINNNGHEDPGGHVLVMKDPPVPEY